MSINVFNRQKSVNMGDMLVSFYSAIFEKMEYELKLPKNKEYNLILVSDKRIKELNKRYIGKNSVTDVICFSYDQGADIFVSVDTVQTNSELYRENFQTELTRVFAHGLLHAVGYEDNTSLSKKRMWRVQERIVRCISLYK